VQTLETVPLPRVDGSGTSGNEPVRGVAGQDGVADRVSSRRRRRRRRRAGPCEGHRRRRRREEWSLARFERRALRDALHVGVQRPRREGTRSPDLDPEQRRRPRLERPLPPLCSSHELSSLRAESSPRRNRRPPASRPSSPSDPILAAHLDLPISPSTATEPEPASAPVVGRDRRAGSSSNKAAPHQAVERPSLTPSSPRPPPRVRSPSPRSPRARSAAAWSALVRPLRHPARRARRPPKPRRARNAPLPAARGASEDPEAARRASGKSWTS